MASKSKIEWTEHTWNPVTGCTKISAGCKYCYAEVLAKRLQRMGTKGYEGGFALTLQPERLTYPIKRKKPTVWFVNSMSDLFHDKVPFEYIDAVFETIHATPHHRYQVLTKRPDRMARYFRQRSVPSNTWLGTSIENKRHGMPRISKLVEIDAQIRFLSIEPLLEDVGSIDLAGISWVIVGGESGPKARPMRIEWVRSIREQCSEAGTSFFFKQWGSHGADGVYRAKRSNGRVLDGKIYDYMPVERQNGDEEALQLEAGRSLTRTRTA
ncbi:MAG TPA: phage Gp37/Gp68 family protein [Dongiaceae bacterium]|nr:phage Gp37/Gp68 family protein [Dongiaceae bacterium]